MKTSLIAGVVLLASCSGGAAVLSSPTATASFDDGRATIEIGGQRLSIALASLGRAGSMRSASTPTVRSHDASVELVRSDMPGVVEWWRAEASALEHGVTIATRPNGDGELAITLAVDGLVPRQDGDAIALALGGRDVARYAGLAVIDADGAHVPASMHAREGTIRIVVDDATARYPLVVDPYVATLEATLTVPGSAATSGSEAVVSISADGSRVLIGAPQDDTGGFSVGSAVVYARTGTTWTLEATLPRMPTDSSGFGEQVALCDDGSHAVVSGTGSAFTTPVAAYVRTGTTWAADVPFPFTSHVQVLSIAISGDCRSVFISIPGGTSVFQRSGATWTMAYVDPGHSGTSMSVNTTGTQVLMLQSSGAPLAYSFSSFGTWVSDTNPGPAYATSAAMSADGTRAIFGVVSYTAGSATIWTRAAGSFSASWSREAMIAPSDATAGDGTGMAVALNHDGSVALVDSAGPGRPLSGVLFTRSGTSWTQDTRLTDTGVATPSTYASYGSVGLTATADRAIIAAPPPFDASQLATADVFSLALPSPIGALCAGDASCASGFCIDGVCCNDACERGTANACRGCGSGTTGTPGTCAPLVAGTTCRASTDPVCDPVEQCNGTSTSCPADTNTCMDDAGVDAATSADAATSVDAATSDAASEDASTTTDGGTDAASIDAAVAMPTIDAGVRDAASSDATHADAATSAADAATTPPIATGSCGCRAGSSGAASWSWIGLAIAVASLARRRR